MEQSFETLEPSPSDMPPPTMTRLILPKQYRLGTCYSRVRNLQGPVYSNHHPLATGEDAASHPLCSFVTALAVGSLSFGLVI